MEGGDKIKPKSSIYYPWLEKLITENVEPQIRAKRVDVNTSIPTMTTAAKRAYSQHDSEIQPDEIADVFPECLNSLKESFYTTDVKITQEEADSIEHNTQQQSDSNDWMKERMKRITASQVGKLAKMK